MAEKLLLKHLLTILFSTLFCFSVVQDSYGQVSLTNTDAFEVQFVNGETRSTENFKQIGISDSNLMSIIGTERVTRFSAQHDLQSGLYFVGDKNDVSVGSYYHNHDTSELISLTLRNDTEKSLSALSVAFDFLYIPEEMVEEQLFRLSYKVNNGSWKEPQSGTFSTDYLQSSEDGWNSFSIHLTLDELFIRNEDVIKFRWTITSGGGDEFIPIALQKIEFNSEVASQKNIKPGSLIISEILPRYRQEDRAIEYLELFNTTAEKISLKGLIITNGDREIVIQKNAVINPYETFLLGNKQNFSDLPIEFNYQYSESLLPNNRGRLTLSFDDAIVAGAMYESTTPGVSLEMDHLSNGRSGYSGMNSFEESVTEIGASVFGSPGRVDRNRKLYQQTISKTGWHFINPIGKLLDPDRSLRSAMYGLNTDMELITFSESDMQSMVPFFINLNDQQPVTIYSEGENTSLSGPQLTDDESVLPMTFTGNPYSKPIGINHIVADDNSQAYPAVLAWDAELQKFSVLFKEDDVITPWSGLILPKNSDREFEIVESESEATASFLESYLSFTLLEERARNTFSNVDRGAVIGFRDQRNVNGNLNNDLPKLKLHDREMNDRSFIFLNRGTSGFETSSYLEFPMRFEEPIQVGLGLQMSKENHNYRIAWNAMQNIPDEWIVELIDSDSDQVINMREENHYTFRSSNTIVKDGMNEDGNFLKAVERNNSKNLVIRVSPYKMVEESTIETEEPQSVNLKQNYPNPFNPATTISFYLPETSFVRLAVYNVVGQQVAMLREESITSGEHSVVWNASEMPSGIYIVQLETPQNVLTRKVTLIK